MKTLFRCRSRFLPFTLLFLGGFFAWGTSFIDRPFPEVVQESPVMVHGKIGTSHVDWGASVDGNKRLYTFYDLAVAESLKGKVSGNSILIREMGGEKDGIGMQVAGASHFEKGEDVVVMLSERNPDASYDIRGLMMGKLNVEKNAAGKDVLVGPAVQGAEHSTEGQTAPSAAAEWTVDALRDLIRSQAAGSTHEQAQKNPVVMPSSLAASLGSPGVPLPSPSAALQLQNSSEGEPQAPAQNSFSTWVGIALLGVGVFATGRFFFKRRKG